MFGKLTIPASGGPHALVINRSRIFLMGASEGTLLAAEAAARSHGQVRGLILYGVQLWRARRMGQNFSWVNDPERLVQGSFRAKLSGHFYPN